VLTEELDVAVATAHERDVGHAALYPVAAGDPVPLVLTLSFLAACSGPPIPKPKDDPASADPVVPAEPEPERPPVVRTVTPHGWGAQVEDCGLPCEAAPIRAQSSSEATVPGAMGPDGEQAPTRILVSDFAADGDPTTTWCATGGVGQRLSLALPEPWDVRRLHLGLARPDPAEGEAFESWTRAKLTPDAKDPLTIELEPLQAAGQSPPVLDVELPGVQFLQLEVLALSGDHPACVREVVIEGAPAS
jgi:hypothetical protein